MKKLLLCALLGAAGIIPANADTFTYGSRSLIGAVGVDIQQPVQRSILVGETELHGAGVNAGQTLDAWCLDLLHTLSAGPYTYQISPLTTAGVGLGNPALTSLQIVQMGDLMIHGATDADKAAIQLAIWKIEYPTFSILGGSAGLLADEAADLSRVAIGASWYSSALNVTVLHDAVTEPNQALGYAVSAIPAPGAIWLFGTGLVSLVALGRRKCKSS